MTSTNDIARQWAVSGVVSGCIRAACQTKGRGRMGRDWYSPKGGNLYASYLRKPQQKMADWPGLSLAASLSVIDALQQALLKTGLKKKPCFQLKWPNDILLNQKKIGGILLESIAMSKQLIIGVGINLIDMPHHLKNGWAAGSLKQMGFKLDAHLVFDLLDQTINKRFDQWKGIDHQTLISDWLALGPPKGTEIQINNGPNRQKGYFYGIDHDGVLQFLNINDPQKIQSIRMAEITSMS
ncbi:MAG: biotin--[acetyl-CoA-carboxylase] ligase [Pseudomonadota bacterium]